MLYSTAVNDQIVYFCDKSLKICRITNIAEIIISRYGAKSNLMIDVQYRRLKSNGKIDFHVVQIALFLKYRSTCPINGIRHSQMQVSRMDQIDQMESNGLHSIKPSQMVKWCLVASAERL